MPEQTVTLTLPEPLYDTLKHRAQQHQRSVEAETLNVLATSVALADALPSDLASAVAPLALLDDASLWRAARTPLAAEAAERMEELHLKRQREGLTEAETQTLAQLVHQYERAMLVRAQAAALLRQRGHQVDQLLTSP